LLLKKGAFILFIQGRMIVKMDINEASREMQIGIVAHIRRIIKYISWWIYMLLTGRVWPHISRYKGWNLLGRCIAIGANEGQGFETEIKAAAAVAKKDARGISYFWVHPFAPGIVFLKESEVRQILDFNSDKHERGPILQTLERIYPYNIFAAKRDNNWKKRRADLLGRVSTDTALKSMVQTMNTIMDQHLNHLDQQEKVELQDLFTHIAMSTIEKTQFHTHSNIEATKKLSEQYEEAFKHVLNYKNVAKIWLYDFAKKIGLFHILPLFMNTKLKIDKSKEEMYKVLKNHLFTPENEKAIRDNPNNVLVKIAKDTQPNVDTDKLKLDAERILLEASFLFLAGHETTARLLQFAVMLLAENPDVITKMREEINAGTDRHYLIAVLKETLRLYPSVPYFGRKVTKHFVIGNIPTPKSKQEYEQLMRNRDKTADIQLFPGCILFFSPHVTHCDETNFKNSMQFIPERFISVNKKDDMSSDLRPRFYFPFGTGDRQCPGQRFSLQEAALALEKIITLYDIKMVDPSIKHPFSINILGTMRATNKVYMQFSKIQNHHTA
jgi:cytochrome P450